MATIPPITVDDKTLKAIDTLAHNQGKTRSAFLRDILTDMAQGVQSSYMLVALPFETTCARTGQPIPPMTAVWRSLPGDILRFDQIGNSSEIPS
jgi:hypothetical protein